MTFRHLLPASLLAVALFACGGGDDAPATPDAGDEPGECTELGAIAMTLSSYPATFSGTVIGGGADLHVAEGVCTEEAFYDPTGEDLVIALTNLTAGSAYGVVVSSESDLGFYVLTDCGAVAATGEVSGGCPLFEDATFGGELNTFIAPASGLAWLVIDNGDPAATVGDFELLVREPECEDDAACAATGSPVCANFGCEECRSNFDCTTAGEAVCTDNSCGAGSAECTGDDAVDTTGAGDDGPADAVEITAPGADTPTTVTGAICSAPAAERDWMKVVIPATERYGFTLDMDAASDLDLILQDAAGDLVALGINDGPGLDEAFAAELEAGTYYLEVQMYAPAGTAAAAAYTLGMFVAECETEYECDTAAEPICGPAGTCTVGTAQCTGDDLADTTLGLSDDGPGGAAVVTGAGVASAGAICNVPESEADFYEIVIAAGEGLTANLAWTGDADLDITVHDAAGTLHGLSFWKQPEVVTLTYLPAGTYYLRVSMYAETAVPAAVAYDLTVTRTADQTCTTATDCAATYSTQLYRGSCAGDGSCGFIAANPGVAGAACDSADDCTSEVCSYVPFESDAGKSVCTAECTTTADCAAVGAGLVCSTGAATLCMPGCAADLECGATTDSEALTDGQPWDYYTCTTATNACAF